MRGVIQELRPDGVAAAIKFATACGCTTLPGHMVPALSLVILDDEKPVAVALCIVYRKQHRLELGLTPDVQDAHRELVDKALMKLRAADVRKCDIRTNGQNDPAFFGTVSWIGQPARDAA